MLNNQVARNSSGSRKVAKAVLLQLIPVNYSWKRHLVMTFGSGFLLICLPLFFVRQWEWKLLAAVATIWFLVAPLIEYAAHRWILHSRLVLKIYTEHVKMHHGAYDGQQGLEFAHPRELKFILMPAWGIALFGFLFALLTPLSYWLWGRDYAMVATAAGLMYITCYELRHMLIHWPLKQGSFLYRLVRWEQTHVLHHQVDSKRYFGVVFPLVDWVIEFCRKSRQLKK
jgi:hypothetical protein